MSVETANNPGKSARLLCLLGLCAVVGVYGLLGVHKTITTDWNRGSDQIAHFKFISFIAEHGRLPQDREEREVAGYKSDGPPLFHWLVGLPGWLLDLNQPPYVRLTGDHPRLRLVAKGEQGLFGSWIIGVQEPYQGQILLWYFGRWLTLAFGAVGLIALYSLIRVTHPSSPWLALAAVALMAFHPVYLDTSTTTSYESLLGVFVTLYLMLLFLTIYRPETNWQYLASGMLLGLACSTKFTPLLALPILLMLPVWLGYRRRWRWQTIAGRVGLVLAGLAITLGSWMSFNLYHFNRYAERGLLAGVIFPAFVGDGSDTTSEQLSLFLVGDDKVNEIQIYEERDYDFIEWLWNFHSKAWGGSRFALLFGVIWIVAIAGLVRVWRHRSDETMRLWLLLLILHLAAMVSLLVLRFWFGETDRPLVRHLVLPGAAGLVLLLIYGLRGWLKSFYVAGLLAIIAVIYLGNALPDSLAWTRAALPVQSVPLESEQRLVRVGDSLALLDFRTQTQNHRSLTLDFFWRADASLPQDYQVEVNLLDAADHVKSGWRGMPVHGRYPTRAWLPGDRVHDTVYLPVAGLEAGTYRLQFRLLDRAGQPLPLELDQAASGFTLLDQQTLILGDVRLDPAPLPAGQRLRADDTIVSVVHWHAGRSVTEPVTYHERATISLSVEPEAAPENLRVLLAGPAGQTYSPVTQAGAVYLFQVEPGWPAGAYRLRLETEAAGSWSPAADSEVLFNIETLPRQFEPAPIDRPLEANFAGRLKLLGYDLPSRRLNPGDSLPLTLHWQALKPAETDFIMSLRLIDETGQVWGGRDRMARETYSTLFWVTGEHVTDRLSIDIDPDAPAGIYQILISWYFPVSGAPVSLPLVEAGRVTHDTSVALGPVKIGQTPPDFTLATARPDNSVKVRLGEQIELVGFDLDTAESAKGRMGEWTNLHIHESANERMDESTNHSTSTNSINPTNSMNSTNASNSTNPITLKLYWQTLSQPDADYTTFVHLRDVTGNVVAQKDQPPQNGRYPTGLWEPGEIIVDTVTISLPEALPAGTYHLVTGLYDPSTGARLAVPGGPSDEIRLQTAQVGQ